MLATKSGDVKRERRAREGDVSWEELLECGEHIDDEQEKLIFSLYTLLPPQRADYGAVEIVPTRARAKDAETNYYIRREGELIINKYKSESRYGPKTVKVPPALKKMLNELPKEQRYVLQNHDGKPLTPNTLSQKVKRMFARACRMHVTINTLRRAWAAKSMRGSPSDEAVAEAAAALDHSIQTHRSYAFLEE